MTTIAWSLSGPQSPAGSLVVNVSVTCPAARSAWLGQYMASIVFALGRKFPVPLVVQVPLVASPPIVPLSWTQCVLGGQFRGTHCS